MPAKRKRERHDFTILSTDEGTKEAEEPVENTESENYEDRVRRVTDAPTNSKFYTKAQEYLHQYVKK